LKIEIPKDDPLNAVADIPEKLIAQDYSIKISAAATASVSGEQSGNTPNASAKGFMSPWTHQTTWLQIAETNTKFMSHYVGRFAAARSPQDLVTITSEFSKEGGLLFKEQSNAIFKMLTDNSHVKQSNF